MNKEISEIYKIYDLIISNKEIIKEQETSKIKNMFGGADVSVDATNVGTTPPSGWNKGIKYILKNGGDIYSPITGKILDVGNMPNTGNYYIYLETKEKNQIYIGNLISVSVQKNQSINIGDKLGEVGKGSYVYVCSKNSSVNDILNNTGDFGSVSSNRYNPSGSRTGDYLASKMSSQVKEGINEEADSGQPEEFGPPLRGQLTVTSRRGNRWNRVHIGIDLKASSGSDILAPLSGEVVEIGENWPCGGTIIIKHNNGFRSGFCHVKQILVSEGDTVTKGQVIGLTGGGANDPMRGRSTGPHLHYTLYKDGKLVNPEDYLGGQPVYDNTDNESNDNESNDNEEFNLRDKAEKILDEVKKKLDLSNMSVEEKKKILDKLTIGAITAAIAAGGFALYSLLSSVLSGVKSATTDTNKDSQRYNPSGSKLGEYIGDIVKFILPG